MKKDSFYFPHDSNAKDDPKCMKLIYKLGLEGYGIYWVLVEALREQTDYKYPVDLIPVLAQRFNSTEDKFNSVLRDFDLFEFDDKCFYSDSLMERMRDINDMREKRRQSGIKGNMVRWGCNNDLSQCDTNAIATQSQIIANKVNKINKNITPPLTPPLKKEGEFAAAAQILSQKAEKLKALPYQVKELVRLSSGGSNIELINDLLGDAEKNGADVSDVIRSLQKAEERGTIKCEVSYRESMLESRLNKLVKPDEMVAIMRGGSVEQIERLVTDIEKSNGRIKIPGRYIIKNLAANG